MLRCLLLILGLLLLPTLGNAQGVPSVVEAQWLLPRLAEPDLVVLDLRRDAEYRAGHLPGAVSVDPVLVPFRRAAEGGLRRLLDADEFAAQMGRLGIAETHRIVLMSRGETWMDLATATDLFWVLKRFGHAQVAILNGGFRKLTETPGVRVVTEIPARPQTGYRVMPSLVGGALVRDIGTAPTPVVVDARLRGQFLGIKKTPAVQRYGTIPGARSLPGNWVTVDGGGVFRTADELRPILQLTGVPEEGRVIVFGNTSLAGSIVWFALRVILGNRDARLMEAGLVSWQENPANPLDVLYTTGEVQRP